MKRLKGILLLVAMLLAFTFTGCGKEDPKALYKKATEKAANTTSLDTTMGISLKASAEGEDLAYDFKIQMQLENKDTKDMKMKLVVTLPEELGAMVGSSEMTVYYADGYSYMDIMGQKIKMPMDIEKFQEQMGASVGSTSDMLEIDVESLNSLSSSKDGENTKLSYAVNKDKMDEILGKALDSYMNLMGQGADISFSDVKGEMVVNKGSDILSQKIELDCAVAANGTNGTMNLTINYTNNKPGETVTVELPNLSDYTEVDSSLLNMN